MALIPLRQLLQGPVNSPIVVSQNNVQVPTGYRTVSSSFTVGTAKQSDSYLPSTQDQYISSGYYLAGAQKILGDSNLIASNIISGVTIFGVQGARIASGGIQTSDATAYAYDILLDKTAYARGAKLTGTIPTVSASSVDNAVFIPVGYINTEQEIIVGSSIYPQTITPTISNQVISSGGYLLGDQTIVGDSNLAGSNIASGVSIFGVTGTYQGSGGSQTNFYKCASVDSGFTASYIVSSAGWTDANGEYTYTDSSWNSRPAYAIDMTPYSILFGGDRWNLYSADSSGTPAVLNPIYTTTADPPVSGWSATDISYGQAPTVTPGSGIISGGSTWTGYKAVLSGGAYIYESSVTSGLTYGSGFVPEVGKVYNDGALIKAELWEGISNSYAPQPTSNSFSDDTYSASFQPGYYNIVYKQYTRLSQQDQWELMVTDTSPDYLAQRPVQEVITYNSQDSYWTKITRDILPGGPYSSMQEAMQALQ